MGGLPAHRPGGGVAVAAPGACERAGHVGRDPRCGGRRGRMRDGAHRETALRVVGIGRPVGRAVGLRGLDQPAFLVVAEGQPQRPRAAVGEDVARGVVGELAHRAARGHRGQTVRRRGIGVGRQRRAQLLGDSPFSEAM